MIENVWRGKKKRRRTSEINIKVHTHTKEEGNKNRMVLIKCALWISYFTLFVHSIMIIGVELTSAFNVAIHTILYVSDRYTYSHLTLIFVRCIYFFLLSKWQTNKYNVIIMLGCASRCRWLCQVNVHEFYWNVKRRIFPHFRFLLLLFLFHSAQVGIVCIYFVSFCFKRVHNSLYTHYTYVYIYIPK